MPVKARLKGASLFVDDVDFDRSARRLLGFFQQPGAKPPTDLSVAREALAKLLGHENLHALRAVATPAPTRPTQKRIASSLPLKPTIRIAPTATLADLGFHPEQARLLNAVMETPAGAILVAGVTGGGKTTTIQCLLNSYRAHNPKSTIATAEFTREHEIQDACPIVFQHSFPEAGPLSRWNAIKEAMLRRDPDLIMVDEIADADSAAGMADILQTGHKLIAAVHANGVFGILQRLSAMGLTGETLGSPGFLTALVYQTLVPKTCVHCHVPSLTDEALRLLPRHYKPGDTIYHRNPAGCSNCDFMGIKGHTVCAEVVVPDLELRNRIREEQFSGAWSYWKHVMPKRGENDMAGVSALEHAIMKIRAGEVSPEAVRNVLGPLE